MSIDTRLSRLTPALSARERAALVLGSLKDGTPEDPAWRSTMPRDQYPEFNRYIALMNFANRELVLIIRALKDSADKAGLRFAWLLSLRLWQEHVDAIRRAVRLAVPEPITETDYAAAVRANREEWVPVDELADVMAGDHEGWTDADWQEDEEGQRQVSDEAWDHIGDAKERELRALAARGKLLARGKGGSLKIQAGAFDDFRGSESAALPEDALSYRVLPDSQAEAVSLERDLLRRLRAVLDGGNFDTPDGDSLPLSERLSTMLRETLAYEMICCWVELRTVELVLDEVAADFGGSHPLKPRTRGDLDETKAKLLQLQEELRLFQVEVVLREPLEEELAQMREWLQERAQHSA